MGTKELSSIAPRPGDNLQVFLPPISSYVPLTSYPLDTTGGMLQQPTEWPCWAGMVDMLAGCVENDLCFCCANGDECLEELQLVAKLLGAAEVVGVAVAVGVARDATAGVGDSLDKAWEPERAALAA